jgi:hypothetical protein
MALALELGTESSMEGYKVLVITEKVLGGGFPFSVGDLT